VRARALLSKGSHACIYRGCFSRYALFALRELRLNPGSIYDAWQQPGQPCRFRDYQSCFNISAAELSQWVRAEGLNSFTVPSTPLNQTTAFVAELRRHNISHLANFYGFDEYNGPMSTIASAFAPLKAAFPEVTTLTTAVRNPQFRASPRYCRRPLCPCISFSLTSVLLLAIAYWLAVWWAGQSAGVVRCASDGGPIS
jgi:hypothetical protein